ncbi:alpha/beta hydrolase [Roseibacterium sp. SDUM158017]|uniref:alpha/beta fold hydrolase n=1 Tax=Roseicyclus salinarum TaxID=3036773 RepID=UPI002414D3A2|nr:alpha/beta hydrolase [Roseibacterium sp. SDUM158017]MDG4648852.1 alpha/beta hydrolase [Roseibacterium sp. SDUM158017]
MKLLVLIALAAALAAGATAWKASRHERLAEAEWPPSGDFLTIDGQRVHYVVDGEGPDLVLIHGASGNLRDFTFDMVGRLKDRYRVIAFDRPGLGYTDRIDANGASIAQQADLLARAASELGAHRPIVFGHSYGGSVALAWAVNRPDALSALVLSAAASNTWDTGLGTYYSVLSHPLGQKLVIPLITAWVPDRVVSQQIDAVFLPQAPPQGYDARIGAGLTLRRVSMRANALHRAGLLDEIRAQVPRYGEIAVPVEILHGDADTTVPLHVHSEPLSRQIPNAALTVLPGVGHMPHHAAPEATDAAIDRAARRATPAP